jgi:AcrR family transcriptional regulator
VRVPAGGPGGGVTQTGTGEGLKARILDEAAALFVRHGYNGLSMRQIAEAVGVSKAGLYYHFEDKEALFLAILLHHIDRVGDLVDQARAEGGSARRQVHRLLTEILTHMRGSQRFIRLAEQDAASLRPESLERMRVAYHDRFLGPIEAMLEAGVTSGELRAIDPGQTTWLLLGMALSGLSTPAERVAETVALIEGVFFDGVLAR